MAHRTARSLPSRDRGAVLVEFSLVFILFAFICYALVAFGLALNLKSNLTHAASEGARAAVGAGGGCDIGDAACQTAKEDAARQRATDALSGQSHDVQQHAQIDPQLEDCDPVNDAGGAQCMRVTVDYDVKHHPIVPLAPGLGIVMPDTLHTVSVVQVSD
jgi:hypothetical protein